MIQGVSNEKHLDSTFKLPMEYLPENTVHCFEASVLSDLELIESTKKVNTDEPDTTPMYVHVFQPTTSFSKRHLKMWAKKYTTDVEHLQDMQRFIKHMTYAQEKEDDTTNKSDHDHVESIWSRIKTDASFRDKFNYIDYAPLNGLNRSSTFLQCFSVYNIFSPVISFLMPVIMMIFPFFILKVQGVPITLGSYFKIIRGLISQHAIGKLLFDVSSVGWDKRIYMIISVIFYFVQMYQNVVSCHRFYRNMFVMHDDINSILKYVSATTKKMQAVVQGARMAGNTFSPFATEVEENCKQLERYMKCFDEVTPFKLNASKCVQIGYVLQQYYVIFEDSKFAECMQYSFGFNAFVQHIEQFGVLVKNGAVSPCKFISSPIPNKKSKKSEKSKKSKDFSEIVNGYYVATELADSLYPVRNTVRLNKRLIITGPNASGKTTILKMTMLNLIFSQQLGYGFYDKSTRIMPYTSFHSYLNIPDTSGRDSLFQAESRRCKEILDTLSTSGRHFCIFDELYSGTNPYEAIASAYGYIDHLTKNKNVDFMLTTHYIQLCNLFHLESNSDILNLHMAVEDQGNYTLKYLYKLCEGISLIKGGIKVLCDLNYPSSIIETTCKILKTI